MTTANIANTLMTEVLIKSTARLHMGFFDLHGGLGRKFGSIGLSLETPCIELSAKFSDKLHVTGATSAIDKVLTIAQQLISKLNINGSVSLDVKQFIPEHAGLGSGTQTALAIGTVISQIYGLDLSTGQIAELTGRGGRSGIGIAAFDHGGLLIDGGRASVLSASPSILTSAKVPPLLARYDFPEDWRILLILDASQPGIHGEVEREAFNKLPEFPETLAAHLCRHVLMQAMPAMVEHDLTAFGFAIQELQSLVGDYFAPAQGGRYASLQVGAVLQYLQSMGVACFGQSSWGPTGFAVFKNEVEAEKYLQQLRMIFLDSNLSWKICRARNTGAELVLI
jgi:beta-RFAP synthase